MLYLIHFEEKLAGHAQHYLGFVKQPSRLGARLREHRRGQGAKILRGCTAAGIRWRLVAIFQGDRHEERRLKNQKKSFSRFCPCCERVARLQALQLGMFGGG